MAESYPNLTQELSKQIGKFRKTQSSLMSGFSAISQAAMSEGLIQKKQKEFIALGIAVAARCEGCIGFHIKALIDLKASREEIEEVLGVAVYMGGGPSLMYAGEALKAFEQFSA